MNKVDQSWFFRSEDKLGTDFGPRKVEVLRLQVLEDKVYPQLDLEDKVELHLQEDKAVHLQVGKGNEEVETCSIPQIKEFQEINFTGPPVIKVGNM